MNRRIHKSRGFTLIELILVLAILVFVVAMVAPSLRGFAVGRRINDAAETIVSLAEYARTQAASEGRDYRLNLDPRNGACWLTVATDDGFQAPANDFSRRVQPPDGVQIICDLRTQPDGQYAQFHSSGRTDPARITLTDRLGHRIVVACLSATEMFRVLTPEEAAR